MRLRSILVPLLALAVASAVLYARWARRPPPPVAEPEAAVVPPPPSDAAATPPPVAGPTASDVQPTLDRLFERALAQDPDIRPRFVTGDFTGDSMTDLAVAVRPKDGDALARLNVELPRWRVQDATAATDGRRDQVVPIAAGERLLAIVHGVPGASWSEPADRPCYLVRNAVGTGMRARPLSGVPAALRMQVTRSHAGDVIVEERGRDRGLILWTGAAYTWAALPGGD